jgi:pheromone shutdown protein TraB
MRDTIEMAHDAGAQFDHMTWVERDLAPVFQRFAELVAAHERNKLAAWMIQFGFATGHGDTMEELVDALGTEIVDRIDGEVEAEREACAKLCDEARAARLAEQIRARGEEP